MPTPVTDSGSDLFFQFDRIQSSIRFASAVGFAKVSNEIVIDSKAMRKVNQDEQLVTVGESEAAGLTSGFLMLGYMRCLIKLH